MTRTQKMLIRSTVTIAPLSSTMSSNDLAKLSLMLAGMEYLKDLRMMTEIMILMNYSFLAPCDAHFCCGVVAYQCLNHIVPPFWTIIASVISSYLKVETMIFLRILHTTRFTRISSTLSTGPIIILKTSTLIRSYILIVI